MWWFVSFLLLQPLFAADSSSETCAIKRPHTDETKLRSYFKKCFDIYSPPLTNDSEPIAVMMLSSLNMVKFDSDLHELHVSLKLLYSWLDDRFLWDPAEYGQVKTTLASTHDIWTPKFKVFNGIEEELFEKLRYVQCTVKHDGIVLCRDLNYFIAECKVDVRIWPYDIQDCDLEIGFHSAAGVKIKFHKKSGDVILLRAYDNKGTGWEIISYRADILADKQFILKFRLRRHGQVIEAMLIYPSIILTVLTVVSLLLDARQNLRLLMLCFSLMCHFDFLSTLEEQIPTKTIDPPLLLLYYRGSFIITTVLIVQSFILKFVCKKTIACPGWITEFNDFVFLKPLKLVIWPRWNTKVDENDTISNIVKDWTEFANIMNSVCLIIILIVYMSLYFVFIPKPMY